MPSYNMTCAISGLPVREGDAVRLLLLRATPGVGAATAMVLEDRWAVRTLPIRAVYVDGGETKDWAPDMLAQSLLDGFKVDGLDFASVDEFQERYLDRGIQIRGGCGPVRIAQALIREEVWQALLREKTDPERSNNYNANSLADYVQSAHFLLDLGKADPRDRNWLGLQRWRTSPCYPVLVPSFGTIPNVLRHHVWHCVDRAGVTPALVTALAEYALVSDLLAEMHYVWRPSAHGGQIDYSARMVQRYRTLADIADATAPYGGHMGIPAREDVGADEDGT